MKIDCHCHTRRGSIDAKVGIEEYAGILKSQGFGGMLVTDHNSYSGYYGWEKVLEKTHRFDDFVVLQGIEYDTRDAGHILVIMPDGVNMHLFETRGMKMRQLIETVHEFGGILGPAHPFGNRPFSFAGHPKMMTDLHILEQIDFIEAFNTCEPAVSNQMAALLARSLGKPAFGGSDSHRRADVATAFTEFSVPIRCNDDFIRAVRDRQVAACGGTERDKKKKAEHALGFLYRVYNNSLWVMRTPSRVRQLRRLEA